MFYLFERAPRKTTHLPQKRQKRTDVRRRPRIYRSLRTTDPPTPTHGMEPPDLESCDTVVHALVLGLLKTEPFCDPLAEITIFTSPRLWEYVHANPKIQTPVSDASSIEPAELTCVIGGHLVGILPLLPFDDLRYLCFFDNEVPLSEVIEHRDVAVTHNPFVSPDGRRLYPTSCKPPVIVSYGTSGYCPSVEEL